MFSDSHRVKKIFSSKNEKNIFWTKNKTQLGSFFKNSLVLFFQKCSHLTFFGEKGRSRLGPKTHLCGKNDWGGPHAKRKSQLKCQIVLGLRPREMGTTQERNHNKQFGNTHLPRRIIKKNWAEGCAVSFPNKTEPLSREIRLVKGEVTKGAQIVPPKKERVPHRRASKYKVEWRKKCSNVGNTTWRKKWWCREPLLRCTEPRSQSDPRTRVVPKRRKYN